MAIVTEHSIKGTERSGQEYLSPLLLLTGQEYARMTFEELHERICDALRGNRSTIAMEILLPDVTHQIIREKKPSSDPESGSSGRESAPSDRKSVV